MPIELTEEYVKNNAVPLGEAQPELTEEYVRANCVTEQEFRGGAPVFGTIACDSDTAYYSNTFTIHNGVCSRDRVFSSTQRIDLSSSTIQTGFMGFSGLVIGMCRL